MSRILVTLGQDTTRDWVKLPTGRKLLTGHISMAKLVGSLAATQREAVVALNDWLAGKEVMLAVDPDSMMDLLRPPSKLVKGSLIAPLGESIPMQDGTIAQLTSAVLAAQESLQTLSRKAAHWGDPEANMVRLAHAQEAFKASVKRLASMAPVAPAAEKRQVSPATAEFKLAKALGQIDAVHRKIALLERQAGKPAHLGAKLAAGRLVSRIASASTSGQPLTEDSVKGLLAATAHLYGSFFPEV